jgi:hypothetical protein
MMNSNSHSDHNLPADDRELDKLLENSCFVAVPADFERNVLQAIASVPQSKAPVVRWWQWLALLGGAVPGVLELAAFIFSIWTVASAG